MRTLGRASALFLGSLPGLLVPFVVVWKLSPHDADGYLYWTALTLIVQGILASTLEAASIASCARVRSRGRRPTGQAQLAVRCAGPIALISAVAFVVVALFLRAVMSAEGTVASYALACAPVALVPPLAAVGSIYSGCLIATGVVARPIFSTFFRGVVVLGALVITDSVLVLSIAAVVGEAARTTYLGTVWRRVGLGAEHESERLHIKLSDLIAQAASMSLSMASPFVARVLLAAGPIGSVAAGEIAFRLFSTATQAGNSLIVLPRISTLSGLVGDDGGDVTRGARLVRSELRFQLLASAFLGLLWFAGAASLWLGVSRLNDSAVSLGAAWSLILITTLPLALGNIWAARAMLVLGRARLLLIASLVGAISMLILSMAQTLLNVASGPIWALAISQSLVGGLVIILVLRTVPLRSSSR
ncbi:hypothetical protein [Nocardioides conyzicola]|uniref:Polysaccharide biosynthesis protein n=1 Tax=Nocardioides conyzicola TaxID=1651781 RepID=A0ABP8XJZ8_9ACTN